jgi:5-methylcytosine-specific restriction endonuclease McrA
MRSLGKVGKEWLKVRAVWLQLNRPNHQGYYTCAIGGEWVRAEEMELDHILPRSARPDLRFVLDNLQPTCHRHNTQKGSKH